MQKPSPAMSRSPATPSRDAAMELAEARFAERNTRHPRSFLSLASLSEAEMDTLLKRGVEMKKAPHAFSTALKDMSIALLFQKTSTRTRCSFENAALELGAFPSYIDWKTSNFVLADLSDEVKVLSRYYDMIVARVIKHQTLETMAKEGEVPVINGLCDRMHPCQGLADFMTLTEYFGPSLAGLRMTYLGDGNNVCRSLAHGAALTGVHLTVCTPDKYALDAGTIAAGNGLIERVAVPMDAVREADVIYTDTWVSMGDEAEEKERLPVFRPYQVDETLMAAAAPKALFMHCLPAHPGQEVTASVLRSPRSVVFDQAENRKHAQKALLEWLFQQRSMPTAAL